MTKQKGFNNEDLKKRNRGLLLQMIATQEGSTRVDLTKKSGLTKMSVTNITDEFLERHLVIESDKVHRKIQGRSPVMLEIAPEAPVIAGLQINREYCSAVLCDLQLRILAQKAQHLKNVNADRLLSCAFLLLDEMLSAAEGRQILGIGVAALGPLKVEEGIILNPPHFYGIRNVAIKDILEARYNLPVFLDHQFNSAARVERLFGYGRNIDSFVFVGMTNGIGAGIYVDGRLLRNPGGLGSELGHMSIDRHGILCECGNRGCVENYAGVNVIRDKVREALQEDLDFAQCCARYREPAVDLIFSEAMESLCVCLVSVANLINPQVIFLGDEAVALPDRYLERMEETVNRRKLSAGSDQIRVLKASFGRKQQLIGAAGNVLDRVFAGKLLW